MKIKNLQMRLNSQKITKMIIMLLVLITFSFQQLKAQQTPKYNLRFVVNANAQSNGGNFDVLIQINAEDTAFNLGSSNLSFNYNKNGLENPVLLATHNFTNNGTDPYSALAFTRNTGQGLGSVDIVYTGTPGVTPGTMVETIFWTDVATIRFTISDTNSTSDLVWRSEATNPQPVNPNPLIVNNDNGDKVTQGSEMETLNVPLPVEFISFTAIVDGFNSKLNWSTASEFNNQGFYIERSSGDRNWETIGFVEGKGNSVNISQYEFIDYNVFNSKNLSSTYYYKLRQIDYDGNFDYSNINIVLFMDTESGIIANINPIPATDKLNISFQSPVETEFMKLHFYSLDGKIVNEIKIDGYNTIADVSNMINGIYQLIILDANNSIISNTRIIINK